jgi:hypothetical protein
MVCTDAWLQGFETYSQFSFRNLCLVSLDWVSVHDCSQCITASQRYGVLLSAAVTVHVGVSQVRTKIFGRDISRV